MNSGKNPDLLLKCKEKNGQSVRKRLIIAGLFLIRIR